LAARQGRYALARLGNCYARGFGLPQSHEKAFGYYQKAADLGCFMGMNFLAHAYRMGLGVVKSAKMADFYLRKRFLG
jgi:TPR repeat protein